MINGWWLAVSSIAWLVVMIWSRSIAYRHGIWDGAFNHFLPAVRHEMMFYDKDRAKAIFDQEGNL